MDLASFLSTLPRASLASLYESPAACAAVLRGLPPLARLYVARLAHLEDGAPEALLSAWPTPAGAAKHAAALAKLRALQLVQDHVTLVDDDDGRVAKPPPASSRVALAPAFRAAVAAAAAAGRPPLADGGPPPVSVAAAAAGPATDRACAALVEAQWAGLLLHLAGAAPAPPSPPCGPAVATLEALAAAGAAAPRLDAGALLASGGYLARPATGGPPGATPAGLTLLLATAGAQVWALLRARCAALGRSDGGGGAGGGAGGGGAAAGAGSGGALAALVALLLQLAAGGGRGPPVRAVPAAAAAGSPSAVAAAARAAADAVALGLAWPFQAEGGGGGGRGRGGGEVWLAPTSLAEALRGGGGGGGRGSGGPAGEPVPAPSTAAAAKPSAPAPSSAGGGYIVVETNFRLYAYTSDPARLAALGLFAAVERTLPNLAVARLTRASVLGALDRGVPVEAIISHLRDHASPHVAHRSPVVPETVMDQVRLWGASRKRLAAAPAVLYDGFASEAEFAAALAAARRAPGGLLWVQDGVDGSQRRCVARADAHEAVRDAIRAARQAV